ncbi:MAG: PEP-CTERM sorting domain-containing protein [Planctomycetota bacterium]|nr:PEP-CTERM sorting domain-containing protein [Planctomycetota bacterium]
MTTFLIKNVNWKCATALLVSGFLAVGSVSQAQADIMVDDFMTLGTAFVEAPPSPDMVTDGPTGAVGILGMRTLTATNTGPEASNSTLSTGGGTAILSTSIPSTASMQTLSYLFDPQNLMSGDELILNVNSFNAGNGAFPDLTVTADSGGGAVMESFPLMAITGTGELTFDFGDLALVDITALTSLDLKFNLELGADFTLNQGIIIREVPEPEPMEPEPMEPSATPEPSTFGMMAVALLAGLGLSSRRRRKR